MRGRHSRPASARVGGFSSDHGSDGALVGIVGFAALAEGPLVAVKGLAQGEIVRGDVLLAAGEALLAGGKLVHEAEAEVVFFGAEVDRGKTTTEAVGGLPTELVAQTGGVASAIHVPEHAQEIEEDGLEKVPIFGAAGEESPQPKLIAFGFVDVDGGQIALAAGGDIEPEAIGAWGGEDFVKGVEEETPDLILAAGGVGGGELAELFDNLGMFEMDPFDGAVKAATLDDGPVHDVVGGSAEGIAHIALLVDFFLASPGLAVREEFLGSEIGALSAVNDAHEPEFDGVGHGDFEIDVPRAIRSLNYGFWLLDFRAGGVHEEPGIAGGAGFLGELIEEGVFAVMRSEERRVGK